MTTDSWIRDELHRIDHARADDLAQLTAAVAALTEVVAHQAKVLREQGERIERLESVPDLFRPLGNVAAAAARRDAEYRAELDAKDVARQMAGGER